MLYLGLGVHSGMIFSLSFVLEPTPWLIVCSDLSLSSMVSFIRAQWPSVVFVSLSGVGTLLLASIDLFILTIIVLFAGLALLALVDRRQVLVVLLILDEVLLLPLLLPLHGLLHLDLVEELVVLVGEVVAERDHDEDAALPHHEVHENGLGEEAFEGL
uniref:Uncharacterized protein n=1 Tax=Strombidium rassoulzadegani TaxID=1082188 RepID=A0A7S3FV88_9SPIT